MQALFGEKRRAWRKRENPEIRPQQAGLLLVVVVVAVGAVAVVVVVIFVILGPRKLKKELFGARKNPRRDIFGVILDSKEVFWVHVGP